VTKCECDPGWEICNIIWTITLKIWKKYIMEIFNFICREKYVHYTYKVSGNRWHKTNIKILLHGELITGCYVHIKESINY
jgi:hypothetical protein